MRAQFADFVLIDKYDVFQLLADYWQEVMQDDIYIIASEGWDVGNQVFRRTKENKNKKQTEIKGLAGLEGRLIPVSLLIATYFADIWQQLEAARSAQEEAKAAMDEIQQEHTGEEGLLVDLVNDAGNLTAGAVMVRLKELKKQPNLDEDEQKELEVLEKYAKLLENESQAKKIIKEKETELEKKVLEKYPTLTVEQIQELVIEKKWFAALAEKINDLVESVAYQVISRIKELSERYAQTLAEIETQVQELEQKVSGHLKKIMENYD